MSKWVSYINGNYRVSIDLETGTKIRETLDPKATAFIPETIESFDCKITNSCDMGCTFCFLPTAKVYREDSSTVPIDCTYIGDEVLSYDHQNHTLAAKKILNRFERPYKGQIVVIQTGDGHIIKCTPNHPIYTKNRGYVPAAELKITDELLSV